MASNNFEPLPLKDKLLQKIFAYYSTIWKDRRQDGIHETWLNNFINSNDEDQEIERINALYLLSKFMYFGNIEMREMLKCVYRDLFKYPIIHKIRELHNDTLDSNFIEQKFLEELESTRFLGVGNPSESGVHLLYYFRQENRLRKELFINSIDLFDFEAETTSNKDGSTRIRLNSTYKNDSIKRLVFIDDICGSGTQVKEYLKDFVEKIKTLDSTIEVSYLMLFGNETGIKYVKENTSFDNVNAVFSLDDTFKCFEEGSRYYSNVQPPIEKNLSKTFSEKYGKRIYSTAFPLGYKNGQLLLGLFYNTPDNTLPIFWSEYNGWNPIFKRYDKIY